MNTFNRPNVFRFLSFLTLLLVLSCDVFAQTVTIPVGGGGGSAGNIGQSAWDSIKGLWFGPAGAVLGIGIFGMAAYYYFKEGVQAVIGVIVIGLFFFCLPALTVAVQNWARTF